MVTHWLPVDKKQRTVLHNGELIWLDTQELPAGSPIRVQPEEKASWGAVRVEESYIDNLARTPGCEIISIRDVHYEDYPLFYRAAGQLRNRDIFHFDPTSGKPLGYHNYRRYGVTEDGVEVFPRTDPCVMGLIELEGENKLLVVRTALRPHHWSLVAGYVENGETIEQALAREVAEETGRHLSSSPEYLFSQPWPPSGSLMFAMRAYTQEEEPVMDTDGELVDMKWISPKELRRGDIGFPPKGTTVARLCNIWLREH